MRYINATNMDYTALNQAIAGHPGEVTVTHCLGQRFLAAGMKDCSLRIKGVPGNALGAYLDGADIRVYGNAQDAAGDTMNAGSIIIHGRVGDTAGYAMRGGKIYVQGDAGYRAGIHMKAYQDKLPVLLIGGRAGSFVGEYQAGGIIAVLGLGLGAGPIVGNYPCTGMHGGKLFLRSDCRGIRFPSQVTARAAVPQDLAELEPYLREYCGLFGCNLQEVLDAPFTVVTPDGRNPYRQMYVAN